MHICIALAPKTNNKKKKKKRRKKKEEKKCDEARRVE